MITPKIHFSYLDTRAWVGKTHTELSKEMEALRVRVKEASGYPYDNSHFIIDDISGHPALTLLFSNNPDYPYLSVWSAINGVCIGEIGSGKKWTDKDSKTIEDWVWHVNSGLTRCNECSKWVGHINHYSFAGGVCDDCYNPQKHLPPDTSGD